MLSLSPQIHSLSRNIYYTLLTSTPKLPHHLFISTLTPSIPAAFPYIKFADTSFIYYSLIFAHFTLLIPFIPLPSVAISTSRSYLPHVKKFIEVLSTPTRNLDFLRWIKWLSLLSLILLSIFSFGFLIPFSCLSKFSCSLWNSPRFSVAIHHHFPACTVPSFLLFRYYISQTPLYSSLFYSPSKFPVFLSFSFSFAPVPHSTSHSPSFPARPLSPHIFPAPRLLL